jgi:hypothetical protein
MKPFVSLSKKQTGPLGLTNPGSDLIKSLDKNLLGIKVSRNYSPKEPVKLFIHKTPKY